MPCFIWQTRPKQTQGSWCLWHPRREAWMRSRWTQQGCQKEHPCLQPAWIPWQEADTDLFACSRHSDFQGLQKVHLQSHCFSFAAEFSHWHLCWVKKKKVAKSSTFCSFRKYRQQNSCALYRSTCIFCNGQICQRGAVRWGMHEPTVVTKPSSKKLSAGIKRSLWKQRGNVARKTAYWCRTRE